ncbi:hypothetical protein MAR_001080, partial [Mya arenaria]
MGLSDNCVLLCILIPAMQCGKYTDVTRLRGDLDAFLANNSGLQLLLGNFLTEPSPRKQVFRSNHFNKLLMLKSAVAEILKEHDAIAHKYMPYFTSQHYLKRDETSFQGSQRFVNVLKTNFGDFGNTAHFDGHQRKKYQRNFSYNTSVQKIDWQPTANHLFQKLALSVIFSFLAKHNATAPSSTTVPSLNPVSRP